MFYLFNNCYVLIIADIAKLPWLEEKAEFFITYHSRWEGCHLGLHIWGWGGVAPGKGLDQAATVGCLVWQVRCD